MQQIINLRLRPSEANNHLAICKRIADHLALKTTGVTGYSILKKSIDARGKNIMINMSVLAFVEEPVQQPVDFPFAFKDVTHAPKQTIIVGAGPAGLFAALQLIELGIKPIILERGKDVRSRRRDLAILNKEGVIHPESNYCFGEGGAGTYSDGKLYTRSNKRGDINRILQLFVKFGAGRHILYESHPHIGTNKLPQIITAMRNFIMDCGGEVFFEKKVTKFEVLENKIKTVITADGASFFGDAVILATGHSARDIFVMLKEHNILIEPKPFALGVRVEHPQELIDQIQYHCNVRSEWLPPASYSLVDQINERGVFSFCMCPGGIIAPASTNPNELVVNGWSPSKRNNPYANSGMVVQVEEKDAFTNLKKLKIEANDPLLFMYFQQSIERIAFEKGGGLFKAPAQRLVDFTQKQLSVSLPENSYLPGLTSENLNSVLPSFVHDCLSKGFQAFGKKMKGYFTNEATVVATESRTSSPVRIPRNKDKGHHPQLINLFPCGEGAGYAGGIVSAAMDGERSAKWIAQQV